MPPVPKRQQRMTFITKNELTKTLKKLQKEGDAAIDFLVQVMNNEDVDLKLRVDCAKDILSKRIDVSKEVNRDSMMRLVAEAKVNNETRKISQYRDVTPDDEEEDTSPVFLPDFVQKVEGVNYEELDKETNTYCFDNVGAIPTIE